MRYVKPNVLQTPKLGVSLLDGLAKQNNTTIRTRDCTSNEDALVFRKDANDFEVLHRDTGATMLTCHLLALEYA